VSPAGPLAGLVVVLTRPRHASDALEGELVSLGAKVLVFPSLEIVPQEPDDASRTALASLASASLAIFVSANAVRHGLEAAGGAANWPAAVPVAAIGDATAAALRNSGLARVISPTERFDSEALLALPELRAVAGQNIIVFRGVGGREVLRATLESRGARVSYVECYRRQKPPTDPAPLRQALRQGGVDAVQAMSAQSAVHFLELAGEGCDWSRTVLLVPHETIARHAAARPFARAVVAGADARSIAQALSHVRSNA